MNAAMTKAQIRFKTAPLREKRCGALSAWHGAAAALLREVEQAEQGEPAQRVRSFAQDAASDLTYALDLLGTIPDAAIVVHGPAGCAGPLRGLRDARPGWIVTNISERDSILGGEAKLRQAIVEARARFAPGAIFVVSSPVVAINNDDIETTTEELRDELGLPIVPVYADGFRSKIAATGLDEVAHALLRHLLAEEAGAPETEGGPAVGLIALRESREDLAALQALLGALGLDSLSFPRHAQVAQIGRGLRAPLLVSVDPAEDAYLRAALHDVHGVAPLAPAVPIGAAATADWLRAVAAAAGRGPAAERLIAQEEARLAGLAAEAQALRGRAVFLHVPPGQALAWWKWAAELGLRVVALKLSSFEPALLPALREIAAAQPQLPLLVGEGQPFEEASLLRSAAPDVYLGPAAQLLPAARLGIAAVAIDAAPSFGYAGHAALLRRIAHRLAHPGFQRFLAAAADEPYSQAWLRRSAHWHIKHEVS